MRFGIILFAAAGFMVILRPAAGGPLTTSIATLSSGGSVEHTANGPTSATDQGSNFSGSATATAAAFFGEDIASAEQTHVASAGFFGIGGLAQSNWFDNVTLHGGSGAAHVTFGFRLAADFIGSKGQVGFAFILGESEPVSFSQMGPDRIDREFTINTTLTYGQSISIDPILSARSGSTAGDDSESVAALAILNEVILPPGATLTSQSGTVYPISGSSQGNPLSPTFVRGNGQFLFVNVPTGLWFDPPATTGFDYQMTTPGSLFTEIQDFPTGFTNPFTISSGGKVLGTGSPGQPFIFPSGGVSQFELTGINPAVDPTNTSAFPLELDFNTPTASFTMTPLSSVPEPSTFTLLATGAAATVARAGRRWRARIRG